MAKRYVVATEEGLFPARPAHNLPFKYKTLEQCKKAWPDKKWAVFELPYDKVKGLDTSVIADPVVQKNLLQSLKERFSHEFKVS